MDPNNLLVITDELFHEFYYTLSSHNIKVEIVSSGESLNFSRNRKTDVVLLDSGSEANQGLKLLLNIKKALQDVPVIFLTEDVLDDIGVKVFKSGAREFFRKPINIYELRDVVESLLRLKKQSIERRASLAIRTDAESEGHENPGTSSAPANILRCFRYIEDNLLKDCSLNTLAIQAHLSKYHFCRIFKKTTGMRPMEYVRVQRIQRAKKLLRSNDLTISMVAEKVGINNLITFERQFKLMTGKTPSAYKKSLHKS